MQLATSFRDLALTYQEALDQHQTVVTATKAFTRGNKARPKPCQDVADSLVNLRAEDDKGAISDCVDVTIPMEYIPLMRRVDSIMATFAFDLILKEILDAPDFDDDLGLQPLFK